MEHSPHLFKKCSIQPFRYSVMFGCVMYSQVSKCAGFGKVSVENAAKVFATSVQMKFFDADVLLRSDQCFERCISIKSLVLVSKQIQVSIVAVIIGECNIIFPPVDCFHR